MIPTLFGDVKWDDDATMRQFLPAHDLEHRLLRKVLIQGFGAPIQASLLSQEPDNDWMGRHALIHLALEKFYVPNSSAPAVTLMRPVPEDERSFYDWHQRHSLIHLVMRQQLGLSGSN